MSYTIEGQLHAAFETQTFGRGFTKREFVLHVSKGPDDKWPQKVKLTLVKDKVGLIDQFRIGNTIRASFDIRGNEHNGRFFVELQAWKLEGSGGQAQGGYSQPQQQQYQQQQSRPHQQRTAPAADAYDDGDGVPF